MKSPSKLLIVGAAAVILLAVRGGDAFGQPAQEVALEYFTMPYFFDQLVRSGRPESEIKEQLINRYSQIVTSDFMVQIRGWVGDSSLQSEDFTEALAAVRPINDPWIRNCQCCCGSH